MLDTYGRGLIAPIIRKIARTMSQIGVTPIGMTIAALIVGLIPSLLIIYTPYRILAVVILWTSGFMDALDGEMARSSGLKSDLGGFLDIVFDRIVEVSIIIAIGVKYPDASFSLVLLMISILMSMTIFLTVGALAANNKAKSFRYQAGLMERTEGFLFFSAMMLITSHLNIIITIFACAIFFTAGQRFIEAISLLKE